MNTTTARHYLATLPYFDEAPPELVERLARQTLRRTYTAGETIFLEGDPADGLWIVEEGRVKIYKLSVDGGEHILHLIGPGGTFNDIATLDGGPNPANAAALSDALIWMLPKEAMLGAMRSDNELALKVVRILARRVRSLVGQIEDLALYSVIVRLARFLIKQMEDPSLRGPGVTRTAIAAHINTTPQTISNALRSLEDSGAIRFDRHRIQIERLDLLRSIAEL